MKPKPIPRRGPALALVLAGILAASVLTQAQTQMKGPIDHFTGTAVNVTGAGDPIQVDLLRWSTDAEREQIVAAAEKGDKELLAALERGQTLGYIWTSESAGYSVRFAHRMPSPDGSERIILATDHPLGNWNPQIWRATGTAKGNNYPFAVLELRLTRKGGEGKSSLFAKVIIDKEARTLALENYSAATLVLKDVKRGVHGRS